MAEKFLGQNGLNKLITLIKNALGTKVDKVDGKGLSTNDYTTTEKNKLSGIASNAQVNVIESVQKNGTNITVSNKTVNITVPTKTSDITNDSGFITVSDIPEGAAASTTVPKMDGTAAVGTELAFARGDHVHPSDSTKVDKVSGKGLSTNDYTTAEKNKLAGIEAGAEKNVVTAIGFENDDDLGTDAFISITDSESEEYLTLSAAGLQAVATIFNNNINSKANSSDVYTKTQTDSAIDEAKSVSGVTNLSLPVNIKTYGHQLLFVNATYGNSGSMHFVPATTSSGVNPTSTKTVNTDLINPFGPIFYYSDLTEVAAGNYPSPDYLWQRYEIELGSSFNPSGGNLSLTVRQPVYLKCTPHDSGHLAAMDTSTPIVQHLPGAVDGKIYILLGIATSATTMELLPNHPVYYYVNGDENGSIQVWTGKKLIEKTSELTNDSGFITSADIPAGVQPYTGTPEMDGTASAGTVSEYARGNHVHPSDSTKVDKVSGKGLSTNDYTTAEKNKLASLATVATTGDYDDLTNKPTIPKQVFVAKYDVTTNAEIYAAFQAGKVVIYYANGGLPCYLRSCRLDYAGFESLLDAGGQVINYIVQNDHWTDLSETYAKANAVANVVKYSTQSLSNSQKTQARTNIGAGTYSKPSEGIPDSDIASAATWNAKQNALTAGTDYLTPAQVNSAIDSKISSVYTPKGSIAFASLPTAAEGLIGDVYNITDAFTTTAAFVEGAGKTYPAGTNVVCVKEGSNYKWDVLAGFIDITEFTETEVQTIWDSVFNASA